MHVILIGHGETAKAMKQAVEMIFGTAPDFHPLSFVPGEGTSDIIDKIEAVVAEGGFAADDTLVVTDLFGGSPYNASATLALKGVVKDVIAGMSLPMCLVLAQVISDKGVDEAVKDVIEQSSSFTRVLSTELSKQQDESEF